jgi:hypothetical protein
MLNQGDPVKKGTADAQFEHRLLHTDGQLMRRQFPKSRIRAKGRLDPNSHYPEVPKAFLGASIPIVRSSTIFNVLSF